MENGKKEFEFYSSDKIKLKPCYASLETEVVIHQSF